MIGYDYDLITIYNYTQAKTYMKHGAKPKDVVYGRDAIGFIFSKEETQELYDKWCRFELK